MNEVLEVQQSWNAELPSGLCLQAGPQELAAAAATAQLHVLCMRNMPITFRLMDVFKINLIFQHTNSEVKRVLLLSAIKKLNHQEETHLIPGTTYLLH